MENLILAEEHGSVYEITLNRPEKRNAITMDLWNQLDTALRQAYKSKTMKVLVIRGAGGSFCVGADIHAFGKLKEGYGADWEQKGRIIAYDMQLIVNRIQRLEVPTIAVIHGHCLGMGFELALACDFRIATTDAVFGMPETLIGLIPDVGGTTRLTRLVGPNRAKELIFTGKQITAKVAQDYGIVNQSCSAEDLTQAVSEWTRDLSKASSVAVGISKRIIDSMDDHMRGFDLEGWAQAQLYAGPDFRKAIQSFADRAPS